MEPEKKKRILLILFCLILAALLFSFGTSWLNRNSKGNESPAEVAQKELFSLQIAAEASSAEKSRKGETLLNLAFRASVATTTVSFNGNCEPEPRVIRASYADRISFFNLGESPQVLRFASTTAKTIPPQGRYMLRIKDVVGEREFGKVSVLAYRCGKKTGEPSGYVMVLD